MQFLLNSADQAISDANLQESQARISNTEAIGCILSTGMGNLEDICDTYSTITANVCTEFTCFFYCGFKVA